MLGLLKEFVLYTHGVVSCAFLLSGGEGDALH